MSRDRNQRDKNYVASHFERSDACLSDEASAEEREERQLEK